MNSPKSRLDPLMQSALAAARAAGEIQRRHAGAAQIEAKGASDITTDVDRACERAIVEILRARHPDHGILAEEGTESASASGFLWLVDPLDGTKNYAHGFPRSCVSVALVERGEARVGVVYNPQTDELFAALAGGGATLNGAALRVSSTGGLSGAMVASGLNQDRTASVRRADRAQLDRLARVLGVAQAVRAAGCCALDLCDVACGRFDAYFEQGLKAWDTAAGALIVREAGGAVTSFDGAPHDPFGLEVLASNGLVHRELLGLVAP